MTGLDHRTGTGSVYYGEKIRALLDEQRPHRAPAMWDDEAAREVTARVLIFAWGFLAGAVVIWWIK